jgi:hypothetical protein
VWCFFDESYPNGCDVACVVACLMNDAALERVDQILYRARHSHFGSKNAKDLLHEIKGSELLSNYAFKMHEKYGHSCNLEASKDILRECSLLSGPLTIRVFGAAVYGEREILKRVAQQKLAYPLAEMLKRISFAATEASCSRPVSLVFDEKLTDRDVSISIRRFVAGINLPNVSHFPLISVSNVSPGIQLADLGAFILGRRAAGDARFVQWLARLKGMEWKGFINGRERFGIKRWDSDGAGIVRLRRRWEDASA